MTAIFNMNIVQSAYASSKKFIQNHKYQLAAVATATSAVAVAALALYSGRISLPQSSEGKANFILASSFLGGGVGAIIGGLYPASKTDTTGNKADICTKYMFRLIGGLAGVSVGVLIAPVASNILLNR
ncbi:MAG: hypothetical protein H7A40_07370 [Chlamydiales bacterium]|nr:hypothetical protein [Chlamydiales bacterium]